VSAPNLPHDRAIQCEVVSTANGYAATGSFHFQFPLDAALNELDQIERCVEQAGQQIKRHLCQITLETADVRCAELLQKTQPHLHKNGKKNSRSSPASAKFNSAANGYVTK